MLGGQQVGLGARDGPFHLAGGFRFSQGLGGLGQQASPLTFGTGVVTTSVTQPQPERNLNPTFRSPLAQQLGGLNLTAPAQPMASQSSSSSVAVSTAQSSDLAIMTSASQRPRVMYIPRQPMSQSGGSNNTGQESVAPNADNAQEQNSSQNSDFSCKFNNYVCTCT